MAQESKTTFLPCPVCSSLTIEEPGWYDICNVCGWEDEDTCRDEPDWKGAANPYTLNEARKRWQEGKEIKPVWPRQPNP
jgi:hypothetical protein